MNFVPQRIFLGWEKTVAAAAAERFKAWAEREADEFRRSLAITPTRDSARKLREETARLCGAMLMPRILPAGALIEAALPFGAPALTELAAWGETLRRLGSGMKSLFPEPMEWNGESLIDIAAHLQSLQRTLAAHGITAQEAARRMDAGEKDRWRELAALSDAWERVMTAAGYQKRSAEAPIPALDGISGRIALIAVPGVHAPVKRMLAACGLPVEAWIHAPEEHAALFDGWGAPLAGWLEQPIDIDAQSIEQTETPDELAARVCSLLAEDPENSALGLCDPGLGTAIDLALHECGAGLHRPEGLPLAGTGWAALIADLSECAEAPEFAAPWLRLARSSLTAHTLARPDHESFCRTLNECERKYFPERLDVVPSLLEREETGSPPSPSSTVWHSLVQWGKDALKSGDALLASLQRLAVACLEGDYLSDGFAHNAAAKFLDEVETLRGYPGLPTDFVLSVLSRRLSQLHIESPRRIGECFDGLGWMELPFRPESRLVLAGFTEGAVPEAPSTDPFLHENALEKLGIEGQQTRTARDAFLLISLIESRRHSGDVRFLLSRHTSSGEPLAPSSLLFHCRDRTLPARVQQLFGEPGRAPAALPRDLGSWDAARLSAMKSAPEEKRGLEDLLPGYPNPWKDGRKTFSPTSLNKFWECPMRFWLRSAWGLDAEDCPPDKTAFEAREAGTIIHDILFSFTRKYPSLAALGEKDEGDLRFEMNALLRREEAKWTEHRYLPASLQIHNIQRRLHAFVRLHLRELEQGWECRLFEHTAGGKNAWQWRGHAMTFRIDRVDVKHDARGNVTGVRVVDYKTGNPVSYLKGDGSPAPEKKCLRSAPPSAAFGRWFPELSHPDQGKTQRRWVDLQMPLYTAWAADWAAREFGLEREAVLPWYCFLPPDPWKSRMVEWENFHNSGSCPNSYYENGLQWAEAAMKRIERGEGAISAEQLGWPPPPHDILRTLYGDSLDWILSPHFQAKSSGHD